jgi:hypothetical protein
MEKPKIKISAKQFVNDLRSGMNIDELMTSHGLNERSLDKIIGKLLANKLIDPSEVPRSREPEPVSEEPPGPVSDVMGPPVPEPVVPERLSEYAGPQGDQCPQCGATASARALTCPECGHVLPGQHRWEKVEPKKPLTDRIPPLLLGSIIAIPVAVALFFFFKDIILPITEARMEKKKNQIRTHIPKGKSPMGFAKEIARLGGAQAVRLELQKLIAEDVLAEFDNDFSLLVAGTGWNGLSEDGKMLVLRRIQRLMTNSGMEVDFEVKDLWGNMVATVVNANIMLEDELGSEQDSELAPPDEPLSEEERKQERIRRGPIDNILPDLKLPGRRLPGRQ